MQLIAISFDGLSVKVTLALLGFCTSGPVLALVIILLTVNGILQLLSGVLTLMSTLLTLLAK